jgi:hypothetical protein
MELAMLGVAFVIGYLIAVLVVAVIVFVQRGLGFGTLIEPLTWYEYAYEWQYGVPAGIAAVAAVALSQMTPKL